MPRVAFYIWIVRDERTGRRRRTTYRMTVETAMSRFPDAVCDEHSVECDSYRKRASSCSAIRYSD